MAAGALSAAPPAVPALLLPFFVLSHGVEPMQIVRATNPPSNAVVVDTILYGLQELAVTRAEATKSRIDFVWVCNGTIGLLLGTGMTPGTEIPPALRPGMRALARVHVHASAKFILDVNIVEVEAGSDPYLVEEN